MEGSLKRDGEREEVSVLLPPSLIPVYVYVLCCSMNIKFVKYEKRML